MDIKAYLERIDYKGPLEPDAETLRRLQLAHLMAVPFENLSIHARQQIILDDEPLFAKIIKGRRGGFCYELNGLFAALLRAMGFDVVMLSAGVATDEGGFGPDFDHMALMVNLEERWLADVGFGDSFLEPLRLDERGEQPQGGGRSYQIIPDDSHLILMQREAEEPWQPLYRFTLQPHRYSDYADMCLYHQTSPQSHFTKGRVCSRATAYGRVTLSGMRFIRTSVGKGREERALKNEEEYAAALQEHFGIVMTG